MSIRGWIFAQKHRRLTVQTAILAAVMLAAYGCVLCVAVDHGGATGVVAASLAVAVCLTSAMTALLMSRVLLTPSNGIAGTLLPTIARTAPPLLLALIVRLRGQALVETGFVYYLVGFYLLALTVELPMSLPRVAKIHGRVPKSAGKDWNVHG